MEAETFCQAFVGVCKLGYREVVCYNLRKFSHQVLFVRSKRSHKGEKKLTCGAHLQSFDLEAEADGLVRVQSQSGLHGETPSQKTRQVWLSGKRF